MQSAKGSSVTTLRRGARAKSYTGTVVNSTGADKCDQRNQIKSLETDPGVLRTLKCDRHRGSSVRVRRKNANNNRKNTFSVEETNGIATLSHFRYNNSRQIMT